MKQNYYLALDTAERRLIIESLNTKRPLKRMRKGFFPTRASCKLPTNTM